MKISETALNQYTTINGLMQGKSEEEKEFIKADLKKITDYGFELMKASTLKKDLSEIDSKDCINAMDALNALAADNNIDQLFDLEGKAIIVQAVNLINAITIISSARKQYEEKHGDEEN